MKKIDVRKCEYYKNGACFDPDTNRVSCRSNANCDFLKGNTLEQQLQRKEKECEELKERLKCRCFDNKSKQYRCTSYIRIAEDYEKDLTRLDKLKQALQEIKVIVKPIYEQIPDAKVLRQILLKISEVEE